MNIGFLKQASAFLRFDQPNHFIPVSVPFFSCLPVRSAFDRAKYTHMTTPAKTMANVLSMYSNNNRKAVSDPKSFTAFILWNYFHIKQKSPDFSVETRLLFCSTIMKWWCQPFGLHTRSFTNSFVCNFLSSSAGFNLCSCFSRLTPVFRFRFRPLWASTCTACCRFRFSF